MKLTKISNNFHMLQTKGKTIWFSYETPIAINTNGKTYIAKNIWSKTTGKHLNMIDNDEERVDYNVIENILQNI